VTQLANTRLWSSGSSVFMAGFVVMALEILGSRLIAPAFGSTIATWSSLISSVLLCMASGALLGGWLADRSERPRLWLSGCFALSAVFLLVISRVGIEVGSSLGSSSLAPSLSLWIASIILIGLPVCALSMIPPCLTKLELMAGQEGRRISLLSAIGTLASLLGILVSNFLFLASGEVGVSGGLVVLAVREGVGQ
jgi:MFS family permease